MNASAVSFIFVKTIEEISSGEKSYEQKNTIEKRS